MITILSQKKKKTLKKFSNMRAAIFKFFFSKFSMNKIKNVFNIGVHNLIILSSYIKGNGDKARRTRKIKGFVPISNQ